MKAGVCSGRTKVRIVAINDVYTLEHLPRLASLLQEARREPHDAFLAVVAGDFLAPSMLSSLDGGRSMVECLNVLGITHVGFGNHEDDVPPDEVRQRIGEFQGQWLATNLLDFDARLARHGIVELTGQGGNIRIGLLGVVTDDPALYRRHPFGGATLRPANATVCSEALELQRAGCSCVVALTHQSLEADRALAGAALALPLPVIIGGHEHVPHLEQLGATWLVKSGSDATTAAIIDLSWPDPTAATGGAPEVSVVIESVASYPEDPELRRHVDGCMATVQALEVAVLLPLPQGSSLSSIGSRRKQTTLGTLVCTLLRDALEAETCLFNGGGLRGGQDYAEQFTFADLKTELPFDNEMVVVSLPGHVVRDAVAFSRREAPTERGGYLQVDEDVQVDGQHRPIRVAGAPLDPDRLYRVAIVRNLLTGLDNLEPLLEYMRANPTALPSEGAGREAKSVLIAMLAWSLWHTLGGFDVVDADHDGVVTRTEMATAIARVLSRSVAPKVTVDLVMNALDHNKDGVISRREANRVRIGLHSSLRPL